MAEDPGQVLVMADLATWRVMPMRSKGGAALLKMSERQLEPKWRAHFGSRGKGRDKR